MQAVRHQVPIQPAAVPIVFAPTMEIFGAERNPLLDFAQPTLPIDVFSLGLGFNQVIPLARDAVAAVVALAPDQGAQLAALDQVRAFVPAARRTALGTYLVNFAGFLD